MRDQRPDFERSECLFPGCSGHPGKGGGGLYFISVLLQTSGSRRVFPGACRGEAGTCFKINYNMAAPGQPGAAILLGTQGTALLP